MKKVPPALAAAFERAERYMAPSRLDRAALRRAFVIAAVLHLAVLFASLPAFGPDPVRVEAPQQQEMKVQFLKPPPPPPKVRKPPVEPVKKKVPRPDPTPDEPEPEIEPAPPEVVEEAPPAPVTAPAPVATGPVRVAPGQGPGLIKRVEPHYPPAAQAARLEGVVVLDAIIDKEGRVVDIKVLREAHPMFTQSAVAALRQWRYSPGPQDVILTVTVTFTMRR
ncbi:MAG: energy transducer TonB [Vicinamibacteraceae bacterium]|nr:energy transducer TonB [Vicinamibacteraceae bacterium]